MPLEHFSPTKTRIYTHTPEWWIVRVLKLPQSICRHNDYIMNAMTLAIFMMDQAKYAKSYYVAREQKKKRKRNWRICEKALAEECILTAAGRARANNSLSHWNAVLKMKLRLYMAGKGRAKTKCSKKLPFTKCRHSQHLTCNNCLTRAAQPTTKFDAAFSSSFRFAALKSNFFPYLFICMSCFVEPVKVNALRFGGKTTTIQWGKHERICFYIAISRW